MAERRVKRRKLTQFSVGDMRDEIKIQIINQQTGGFDNASFCEQYIDKYTVFAMVETVETVGGGERVFDTVNLNDEATHKFTMRFIDDLNIELRILWNNQIFQIVKVDDPNGRHQYSVARAKLFGDRTSQANQ